MEGNDPGVTLAVAILLSNLAACIAGLTSGGLAPVTKPAAVLRAAAAAIVEGWQYFVAVTGVWWRPAKSACGLTSFDGGIAAASLVESSGR